MKLHYLVLPNIEATFATVLIGFALSMPARAAEPVLIGHWPLRGSDREQTGAALKITSRGVEFDAAGPGGAARTAARFNGRDGVVEVADAEALRLGTGDFSISLWVNTAAETDDVPGDLVSQYDPATRNGFHLGLYSHGGVTNAQSNSKQLHFGIDQGRLEPEFTDHGRLGNAVYVFSLCVHDGRLYASTCHAGAGESGRVFRFEGGNRWKDLGSPDKANAISAMATFNGSLYVASSKYRLAGSALAESQNPNFGGKVYRLGDDDKWVPCGVLSPETEAVASLIVFRGRLYAGSLYKPAGFFRYEGGERWTACATPDGKRVEALTVFNGAIFATCYDEGSVFRFDGSAWEHVGKIPEATQTYGFAVHRGSLFVSEWPKAHVYRYAGGTNWVDAGRLGEELETMPLLVYNGQMYGGTLPSAAVYRFDGDTNWTKIGRVDHTPDVKYRRAWSMAVFQGRLFVGALPSGRVLSIEAGRNATYDRELAAGWHHVAAVRGGGKLQLYVDGKLVGESAVLTPGDFNLTNRQPLRIGFGAQDYFRGDLTDVQLYRGALSPGQVLNLFQEQAK
ncbi:MAG: LamG domain-containing protein [Planctomycetia bacterium]|nr:LamG domain-containing protein [Planctomycetia bacterium]